MRKGSRKGSKRDSKRGSKKGSGKSCVCKSTNVLGRCRLLYLSASSSCRPSTSSPWARRWCTHNHFATWALKSSPVVKGKRDIPTAAGGVRGGRLGSGRHGRQGQSLRSLCHLALWIKWVRIGIIRA